MIKRLVRDESGMAMGLTVIMIVLIGAMGAGLLTFVVTDLRSMAESNRGQQALHVADAGVEAAKRQIIADDNFLTSYDGGTDDLPWSIHHGSGGMTLNMNAGSAKVSIQLVNASPSAFRVISEGQAGGARRKIEVIFQSNYRVTLPRAFMSRTDIEVGGNARLNVSIFALRDARVDTAFLPVNDVLYRRWAETNDAADSYPNAYNATPRGSSQVGAGALRSLCGNAIPAAGDGRSYGGPGVTSTACPTTFVSTCPRVVRNYTDSLPTNTCAGIADPSQRKIAFPFKISTEQEERDQLEVLRQRALSQETTGNPLYMDSNPGNGLRDEGKPTPKCRIINSGATAGRSADPEFITSWPSGSSYDTVRFYTFQAWNPCNALQYQVSGPDDTCPTSPAASSPRGVLVVENGDLITEGTSRNQFFGGIIVRSYNASGESVREQGRFWAAGTPCLRGYANSGGLMSILGTINVGSVPELGSLRVFRFGTVERLSWRELYQ